MWVGTTVTVVPVGTRGSRWREGTSAAFVAEPSGARRSGDGRGAPADPPLGHAAAARLAAVVHSAANTAGVFIPSAECGRLRL
jgi:hypothetical protein